MTATATKSASFRSDASRRAWETIRARKAAGLAPLRPRASRGTGKRAAAPAPVPSVAAAERLEAIAALATSDSFGHGGVVAPAVPRLEVSAEVAEAFEMSELPGVTVVELAPAVERDTSSDEAEWLALENSAANVAVWGAKLSGCRPAFPNRPHRKSYGADLPLRSELNGRDTKRWTLTAAEKSALEARPLVFRATA